MRLLKTATMATLLAGACLIVLPGSGGATALSGAFGQGLLTASDQGSAVVEVQWHGRRSGHGGQRHGWHRGGRGNGGAAAAGAIMGLAIGAIIATEAQRHDAVAYCSQRFRSFNPATMTYTGFDGLQHPCP